MLFAIGLLAVSALVWRMATRSPARRPNIVLISIDTLRQDHVSAYGYPKPTTPSLDALAAGGALFRNAQSPAPWTLPAHVSALTGLPASVHGVESDEDHIPPDVTTLAEVLSRSGYATAGFASHVYLEGLYDFSRGCGSDRRAASFVLGPG